MEESADNPRSGGKPPIRWQEIAQSPDFIRLESLRRRVTAALLGVFVLVFGAFLVCCGYARPFMRRSVDGGLTVAYVWLMALTLLAWALVYVYLRISDGPLGALGRRVVEQSSSAADGARGGPDGDSSAEARQSGRRDAPRGQS